MGQVAMTFQQTGTLQAAADAVYLGDPVEFERRVHPTTGVMSWFSRPGIPFVRVTQLAQDMVKPYFDARKRRYCNPAPFARKAYFAL